LDVAGAAQRIDGAAEFRQKPVPGGLDDAPVMGRDARVDDFGRIALSRSSVPCSSAPMSRE